jgi:hypothetical protein
MKSIYQIQSRYSPSEKWLNTGLCENVTESEAIKDLNTLIWIEPSFEYRLLQLSNDDEIIAVGKSEYPKVIWQEI